MTEDNNQPEDNNTEPTEEKRKGFHPILVLSTIAVVLFVLWFCPWAIMRARVNQNEKSALAVLSDPGEKYRLLYMNQDKIASLLREGKFKGSLDELKMVARNYIRAKSITRQNNIAICLTPKYYGRTADTTFYLINNKVYSKDLGKQYALKDVPTPDKTWKAVAAIQ